MPDATVAAFVDHGTVAQTVDQGFEQAGADLDALGEVGVDMEDVSKQLEDEGVAAFSKSYDELLQALEDKAKSRGAKRARGRTSKGPTSEHATAVSTTPCRANSLAEGLDTVRRPAGGTGRLRRVR